MVSPNKARVYRRRSPTQLERKCRNIDRNRQGGSRAGGSRVGRPLEGCLSTKEFEGLFWIPARTMESYEQGRRNLGAMRALLRIIDREPKATCRTLTR